MNRIPNLSNSSAKIILLRSMLMLTVLWGLKSSQTDPSQLADKSVTFSSKTTLSSSTRSFTPNFVCSNVNSIRVKSWRDRDFWKTLNKLNPATIRIPGGDESNYWDWRKGGTIDDISQLPDGLPDFISSPKDRRYNNSKLEDYYVGIQKNNKTPIFVLNMLSDNLQSQMEMLITARDLGMSVKYIELGNEFYFPTPNYRSVFPKIEDYTEKANQWISTIKQEFPQAKVAVVGMSKPGNNKSIRVYQWNEEIIATTLPLADAITIHTYPRNGLVNREISTEEYPYYRQEDVRFILGEPFKNWKRISNVISDFPENKKIWVTEYNLMEDINATQGEKRQRVIGSWTHGIYAVLMGLLFLEDSRIDIACNHMLIGSSQFSAILSNEKSFKKPSDKNTVSQPLALSATGSTLKLLGDVTKEMTNAQKINFANNFSLTGKDEFTYPALYGWMFVNATEKNSLILNLSPRPIEVEISSLFDREINYETVSGSPRDLITQPGILQQKTGEAKQKITLPAYSVTKMSTVPMMSLETNNQFNLDLLKK